jgi:hypothetical protein
MRITALRNSEVKLSSFKSTVIHHSIKGMKEMVHHKAREPVMLARTALVWFVVASVSLWSLACRFPHNNQGDVKAQPPQKISDTQKVRTVSDGKSPPPNRRRLIERKIQEFRRAFPRERDRGSVAIPVYFHILTSADGKEGNVSCEVVQKQIEVLNLAYAGKGGLGSVATPFRFVFAGMDITANDVYFNMAYDEDHPSKEEIAAKKELNRGNKSTLNIYTAKVPGSIFGWARFPWDLANGVDGVVVRYTTLPGGTEPDRNEGDVATHEVGHWLGLFHTFENGCNPPGDSVDDTPAQSGATLNCPVVGHNHCPGEHPEKVENYMNYCPDSCMFSFTAGQSNRMDAVHLLYRT